jgi:DNA invertase Pin-like site-specific DNA recombinase
MKRTTTEAELRQWVAEGKSAREIGEILGCGKSAIGATKSILGIKGGAKRGNAPIDIDFSRVREIFLKGGDIKSAAAALKISVVTLRMKMKEAGLPTSEAEFWKREAKK